MMTRIDNGRVRPQLERFNLTGTFEIGAELDSGLVLVSLADMQTPRFAGTGRFGSRLVLHDPFTAPEVGQRLRAQLGGDFRITDWGSTYGELFRAVKLEKSMMFLLLVLIVGIAAFNIVAGQTMQVNDKRGDIAILRTMGAGDGVILRVFLQQGFLTAIFGVSLGVLLGIVLALNITEMVVAVEQMFDSRLLAGTYFLEVPSQLQVVDLLGVVAITLLISAVAAFVPAYKSLAVNPITALHSA
jgi:lipoprotein-releasing system permease protein